LFDKGLVGSGTIALWLGLLPLTVLWFTLHAISKRTDKPLYKISERKVLAWIVVRYPLLMLIVSLGSWMGRMDKVEFDSFSVSVLQNSNEVIAALIWIVAAAIAILFIVFRPPFSRKKENEGDYVAVPNQVELLEGDD
jgi:uncharacterized membrane protein